LREREFRRMKKNMARKIINKARELRKKPTDAE
jgi:hypothetical protein